MSWRVSGFISIVLVSVLFVSYLGKYGNQWNTKFPHPNPKMEASMLLYKNKNIKKVRTSTKQILVYTSFFGSKPWGMATPIVNYTKKCGCNFDGCEITYNQNKIKTADIVLFHGRDMPNLDAPSKHRPPNQLWLYFIMENPFHAANVGPLDHYFNLTSSYRLSSDVRFPYRFHMRIPSSEIKPIQPINYAKGKTKQIAWAVSNCGHQRDQLAKKLHEYGLQIDNFGNCNFPFVNRRSFSRGKGPYNEYKFVFAAENRLCNDYVTEKYWKHAFDNNANAIPIVFGGSDYTNPEIAIPGSFIEALKFSSPKKLAEYLLLLDKNDNLYNEYFKWKQHWTFYDRKHPAPCTPFMCDMCEKLQENSWTFKKNPLTSTINTGKECRRNEDYFRTWINKV